VAGRNSDLHGELKARKAFLAWGTVEGVRQLGNKVGSGEDPGDLQELGEEQMNAMIEQLCESKAEEFRLIGYDRVSGQDVWECVSDKYHKNGTPPLYQVVNDILSLKVTQFMNYITLNMYRGDTRKK
jgi:hypothetical protein